MRTKEEISTEIKKVKTARKAAVRKLDRCNERFQELYIEMEGVVCQAKSKDIEEDGLDKQ